MRFLLTAFFTITYISAFSQSIIGWQAPYPVAGRVYGNLHPRIKLDKLHNPMVVWGDENGKAWFAKWGGEAFSQPVSIGPTSAEAFATSWAGPDIAAHGDTVYITYKEIPEETSHIYIKHSYDGGINFSAPALVDDGNDFISRFPTITTDEAGNPYISYMKVSKGYDAARYVVAKSLDLGESFLRDTTGSIQSGANVCECSPASLVVSGNAAVLLYRNNSSGLRNIWGGISMNACTAFRNSLQLDSTSYYPATCPASGPHGVIVGDTLYSVYMSGIGEKGLVYLSKLSLSTSAITTMPLTGPVTGVVSQNFPRISGNGIAEAIVWTQTVGGNNQVCLSFTGELTNGFPQLYDTVAEGVMINADVAIGGGFIYVVWEDHVNRCVMFRRGVYYKKKTVTENTTIFINQPEKGQKYFSVVLADIVSCALIDATGSQAELDLSYPKNSNICHISIDDMDPGAYTVKIWDKEGKVYTAQLQIK